MGISQPPSNKLGLPPRRTPPPPLCFPHCQLKHRIEKGQLVENGNDGNLTIVAEANKLYAKGSLLVVMGNK